MSKILKNFKPDGNFGIKYENFQNFPRFLKIMSHTEVFKDFLTVFKI
jgi:hypothetical protein